MCSMCSIRDSTAFLTLKVSYYTKFLYSIYAFFINFIVFTKIMTLLGISVSLSCAYLILSFYLSFLSFSFLSFSNSLTHTLLPSLSLSLSLSLCLFLCLSLPLSPSPSQTNFFPSILLFPSYKMFLYSLLNTKI